MPVEDDVLKVRSKLEKMISSNSVENVSALDMLKSLQDLPMTLEVLTKTRIGMTVNNFRKATDNEEVTSLAKNLIKIWKKLLPDSKENSVDQQDERALFRALLSWSTLLLKHANKRAPHSKADSKGDKKDKEKPPSKNGDSMDTESSQNEESERRPSTSADDTCDPIRLKCRELLLNALKPSEPKPEYQSAEELAPAIEDNIYNEFKNTDTKYKNRVRSRVANLKDPKNPDLKNNVLTGMVPPDRIAKMTAEEMACKEMKELRGRYTKEAIDDHQMAKTGGTVSDLFKCGKCGKKNCTYNQVQTRSADEPMTTFVFCNECGNRWKFC